MLLKEKYLAKANADKIVKQKIDLDMHLKLKEQRKLLDGYDTVGTKTKASGVGSTIQDVQNTFKLSPHEY